MALLPMLRRLGLLLLPLIILAGCRPIDLERQQVPIMWGMRYENEGAEVDINGNLAEMRRLVLRELVLELPVVADSAGLPQIRPIPLTILRSLLQQYKTRLHIALTTVEEPQLFPNGNIADPDAWFAALEQQTDSILNEFSAYPPERVIVGNDWLPMEQHPDRYGRMLNRLRDRHTNFFSYAAQMDRLDEVTLWPASDEITVDYTPSALADQKAHSREYNRAAGAVAQAQQKSIFIFRANILGTDPLLQFKNRLRFWPEGRTISGLCINTIYSKIAARDSSTYYGLGQAKDLFEYLDEYRRPPE